jgi:histidine triad (HIT) family protein
MYDNDNIFAKILRSEIPNTTVFEDDNTLVIMDVMPVSAGHCLIIPKAPSRNLLDANTDNLSLIIPIVQKIAIAVKKAMQADGVIIQQFNEESAGQTVFHLHFHVIPTYDGQRLAHHSDKMADQNELKKLASLIADQIK